MSQESDQTAARELTLSRLSLSVRTMTCLENLGMERLGDLYQKTEQELLREPNFGRKSLNEIRELLQRFGLPPLHDPFNQAPPLPMQSPIMQTRPPPPSLVERLQSIEEKLNRVLALLGE